MRRRENDHPSPPDPPPDPPGSEKGATSIKDYFRASPGLMRYSSWCTALKCFHLLLVLCLGRMLWSSKLRNSREHSHRNSREHSHWAQYCEDPCSCPEASSFFMGKGGEFGALYVVAGDRKYAANFEMVVGYLRNTLKIPNASERHQNQMMGSPTQMRWALVTEPGLCRQMESIMPFFDIVVTVTSSNDSIEFQKSANLLMPEFIQNPALSTEEAPKAVADTSIFQDPYLQNPHLVFWAKALKVVSLSEVSPFQTTMFIDADNFPCTAKFGHKLLEDHNLETSSPDSFDIAAIPLYVYGRGTGERNTSKLEHWFDKEAWEKEKANGARLRWRDRPTNLQNTRIVLLNLKSPRTQEFLKLYRHEYLYSIVDHNHDVPVFEQPSFGKAALNMHLAHGSKWKYVGLVKSEICDGDDTCGLMGSPGKSCLMVHKMKLN